MEKVHGDIIILHMCTIDDNHMKHGSWDIEHDGQNFLSFWNTVCPFTSITTQKIKILKKWRKKKTPRDIITLHKCVINDNNMMYGSWNMKCDGQNFLSFWTAFCPFTPLTTRKIKLLKNWKKLMEISFYTSAPKIMIICYTVP